MTHEAERRASGQLMGKQLNKLAMMKRREVFFKKKFAY
jgi:hypothetical protein